MLSESDAAKENKKDGACNSAPEFRQPPPEPIPKDFSKLLAPRLIALAERARDDDDPVLAGRCVEEAQRRRAKTARRVMAAMFEKGSLAPVSWLDSARQVARRFSRTSEGGHHLYVILLEGFRGDSPYGVYVGESRYLPENRFRQHKADIRAAGAVRRMGLCLLPSLYAHLNPLSRGEAKRLERALAEAFSGVGIVVRGGH